MDTVSKPFYFGSYLAAMTLATLLTIGPLIVGRGRMDQELLPFTILGGFISLYAIVVFAVLVYKMWTVIPPEVARTTPGKAVGFLFIPVFNLYWGFPALWGWAQDWNAYAAKSEGRLQGISENLPLLIAVFAAVSGSIGMIASFAGAPGLATLLGVPNYVLIPIFIYIVCDLLNSAPPVPREVVIRASQGPQEMRSRSFGLASLILGILSIVLPYLGLLCGIVAIVLARKQRRAFRELLSMAGLVTGIIGTVLWGLAVTGLIIVLIVVSFE